jgi:hypothetical protein
MAAGDVKLVYATEQKPTFAIGSMATSSTLLAGYETSIIDNSSNLFLDYLIGGKVTVGTTPTINTVIEIWAFSQIEDSPTYPDVFDGTAGAETLTSAGIKNGLLTLIAVLQVDATTSDRVYPFQGKSIRAAFGGVVPKKFGFFVTHNTGVNLNSTAGNHELTALPVYENVAQ